MSNYTTLFYINVITYPCHAYIARRLLILHPDANHHRRLEATAPEIRTVVVLVDVDIGFLKILLVASVATFSFVDKKTEYYDLTLIWLSMMLVSIPCCIVV